MWFRLLASLYEFGICCECAALKGFKEEELTTGTGYLRSKGWIIKMSFKNNIGYAAALTALQDYIRRLNEKYSKKVF
jgi:hypothetical protein